MRNSCLRAESNLGQTPRIPRGKPLVLSENVQNGKQTG